MSELPPSEESSSPEDYAQHADVIFASLGSGQFAEAIIEQVAGKILYVVFTAPGLVGKKGIMRADDFVKTFIHERPTWLPRSRYV